MTLKVEEHFRRPFSVEAVKVTQENMEEVAEWCGGEIRISTADTRTGASRRVPVNYVRVPVTNTKREIASMALVNCWVVKMGASFRVYNPTVFASTFSPADRFVPKTNVTSDMTDEDIRRVIEADGPHEVSKAYKEMMERVFLG